MKKENKQTNSIDINIDEILKAVDDILDHDERSPKELIAEGKEEFNPTKQAILYYAACKKTDYKERAEIYWKNLDETYANVLKEDYLKHWSRRRGFQKL